MINFRKDFTFYVSIILVVLLLLSATTKNAIFLYLLFGASLLLINNPVYLLPVYIIASLSGNFFDIGGGFSISRIVALVFIIGSGFKYGGSFNVNKNYINPILLIFFFNIISSVTSLTGSMWGFLEMLPNLLIVFICSGIKFPHINKLTFILTISSIITIALIALNIKDQLTMIQIERLTTGDNVNQNRFAMMLAQLIAILFASFTIFKKYKFKFVFLITIAIGFIMVFLSGSRSAFVGITLSSLFIYLYYFLKVKIKVLVPIIVMAIIFFNFYQYLSEMGLPVVERFTYEDVRNSGGTNRWAIWETLVPYNLVNYPFFGVGLGAENVIAIPVGGIHSPAHNFVIDLFLQMGLFGLILYFSFFLRVAKTIKAHLDNPYIFIPFWMLLTAFINGIGETIFPEKLFWNGIALTILFANNLNLNKPVADLTKNKISTISQFH